MTRAELSTRVMARNLTSLGLYFAATEPETFNAGADWYGRRLAELLEIAARGPLPAGCGGGADWLRRTCDAVATLSADTSWGPLMDRFPDWLEAVVRRHSHGEDSEPEPSMPCYGENLRKARGIVLGDISTVSGPKVSAFAYALFRGGAESDAVVDRHAWRQAVGTAHGEPPGLTPARYKRATEAFRLAAAEISAIQRRGESESLSPAQFQAALWTCEVGEYGRYGGAPL